MVKNRSINLRMIIPSPHSMSILKTANRRQWSKLRLWKEDERNYLCHLRANLQKTSRRNTQVINNQIIQILKTKSFFKLDSATNLPCDWGTSMHTHSPLSLQLQSSSLGSNITTFWADGTKWCGQKSPPQRPPSPPQTRTPYFLLM